VAQMREPVIEIPVPRAATAFIVERLNDGNTLAKAMLETLSLAQGCVTTFLPRNVIPESLEDFASGGKLPTPPVSEWKSTKVAGETLLMIPVPTTDSLLVAEIKNYLLQAKDHVCILEDALKMPGDAVLRRVSNKLATYNTEVYHLLFHEDAQEERILGALNNAKSLPTFIGALTEWPSELLGIKPRVLSLGHLQTLAARTNKLFVGAYDGESYLLWSNTRSLG
jgi:hypothetical protein